MLNDGSDRYSIVDSNPSGTDKLYTDPYSGIALLSLGSGADTATGQFLGLNTILTAAHTIYVSPNDQPPPVNAQNISGYTVNYGSSSLPIGQGNTGQLSGSLTPRLNGTEDLALILNQSTSNATNPTGAAPFVFGLEVFTDPSMVTTIMSGKTVQTAGFPEAQVSGGEAKLIGSSGTLADYENSAVRGHIVSDVKMALDSQGEFYFTGTGGTLDAFIGQSGSPIWTVPNSADPYYRTFGALTTGDPFGQKFDGTVFEILTTDNFNQIMSLMAATGDIQPGYVTNKIHGSYSSDTIKGAQFNDIIVGYNGADVITTGAGNDVVQGSVAHLNGDRITDFSTSDKIVLESSNVTLLQTAMTASSTVLRFDSTGNGSVDASITLSGNFTNYGFDTSSSGGLTTVTLGSPSTTPTPTPTPTNAVPNAVNDAYNVTSGASLNVQASVGLLANDVDADGDALSATIQSNVSNGQLFLSSNGGFSYTPDSGFVGTDTFTYKTNDGNGGTDIATVSITVTGSTPTPAPTPSNNTPNALNDAYAATAGSSLSVAAASGLLSNDQDADGDTLTATLASSASNGQIFINSSGGFSYTPDAGFNGTDSFTYRASDGNGGSDIATVTITVSGGSTSGGGTSGGSGSGSNTDFSASDYANQIYGDAGNNPLQGTSGNDWIEGGAGQDNIFGGAGNDFIIAGAGNDVFVRGGTGSDIFQFGPGDGNTKIYDFEQGADKIYLTGGLKLSDLTATQSTFGGVTTLSLSAGNGDVLYVRNMTVSAIRETDFLVGSSSASASTSGSFSPSAYDNLIVGDAGNNALQGTAANDWIEGGAGQDNIFADDGDDYIIAGSGNDVFVRGGGGSDIFQFGIGDGAVKIYDFENGADKIHLVDGLTYDGLNKSEVSFNGVKTVALSAGNGDTLYIRNASASQITEADFVTGPTSGGSSGGSNSGSTNGGMSDPSNYANQLYGTASNDPIQGTSANDYIDGGAGRDNIFGGDGNDYIIAGAGEDSFVRGGAGADVFQFGRGDGAVKVYDYEDGLDKIDLVDNMSFASLTMSAVDFGGISTVVLNAGNGDILYLRNIDMSDVGADDFV